MGSTLTQFASLILRTASAWVDGPCCGQVLCHAPGPCTDGSDEPPPWPHQDEMPVAWCSSRLAFRSGVFFCVPLRVFSSPGSCTQRGWALSRASPRSPPRLLPAALARMQASHGSHCTCATGPCRPAVPLLFLLSASAGGRALSLKAPRSCDPSRRPPSWCDIFPHATAHDVHGVSLHVPFLLLGGAAPSVFSFFSPSLLLCGFSQEECHLGLAPPSDKSPRSHAVLGAHSWGPSAHALAAPSPSCLACCGRALHTGHADPVFQPKDSVLAAHATWPRMRERLAHKMCIFSLSCFPLMVHPPGFSYFFHSPPAPSSL